MKHNSGISSVMKSFTAGAIVGTATYMLTSKNTKSKAANIKKNTGKALKAVSNVIENVSYIMK